MLFALGIPAESVEREVGACDHIAIAATNSRSVLGALNDYVKMLQWSDRGLAGHGSVVEPYARQAH